MTSRRSADDRFVARAVGIHPHAWLWEPLADSPSFVLRSMFGTKAVYLDGKLMLAFCASEEPWRGVLVCTSHEHHRSLRRDYPALVPHPILPKWLYLSEAAGRFESVAAALVRAARQRDPRLGVTPASRRKNSLRFPKRPSSERPR